MKDRPDAILQKEQARYLDTLLPPHDALLERMEKFAAENDHPIADPEVAQLMRVLVRAKKPRHIIEVGTNIGYSVIVMENQVDAAVNAAHAAFDLGTDEVEAVVYGGTGR